MWIWNALAKHRHVEDVWSTTFACVCPQPPMISFQHWFFIQWNTKKKQPTPKTTRFQHHTLTPERLGPRVPFFIRKMSLRWGCFPWCGVCHCTFIAWPFWCSAAVKNRNWDEIQHFRCFCWLVVDCMFLFLPKFTKKVHRFKWGGPWKDSEISYQSTSPPNMDLRMIHGSKTPCQGSIRYITETTQFNLKCWIPPHVLHYPPVL